MGKSVKYDNLMRFCSETLVKEGMNIADANLTAEVLVKTDAFGIYSHGTKNLHDYIRKIRAEGISINIDPEVVNEGPSYALIDAKDSIGMISSCKAMDICIEKASETGVAIVVTKNANHFGAAGYYSNMAAEKNMIGICMSNVDPNMTIPGAKEKIIGNNPISYAVPSRDNPSIFLDIALSSVASLKVIQAKKDGNKIPNTWIVDKDGRPTDNPDNYPKEGAMLPMAGHKGYGLALMVDLLTGVLANGGSSLTGEIDSWLFNMKKPNNVSQTFVVIDISKFISVEDYKERTKQIGDIIHGTAKVSGVERLYLPGEMEWDKFSNNTLELPEDVVDSLTELSKESGINLIWEDRENLI